jgi:hypothetical protein
MPKVYLGKAAACRTGLKGVFAEAEQSTVTIVLLDFH